MFYLTIVNKNYLTVTLGWQKSSVLEFVSEQNGQKKTYEQTERWTLRSRLTTVLNKTTSQVNGLLNFKILDEIIS